MKSALFCNPLKVSVFCHLAIITPYFTQYQANMFRLLNRCRSTLSGRSYGWKFHSEAHIISSILIYNVSIPDETSLYCFQCGMKRSGTNLFGYEPSHINPNKRNFHRKDIPYKRSVDITIRNPEKHDNITIVYFLTDLKEILTRFS